MESPLFFFVIFSHGAKKNSLCNLLRDRRRKTIRSFSFFFFFFANRITIHSCLFHSFPTAYSVPAAPDLTGGILSSVSSAGEVSLRFPRLTGTTGSESFASWEVQWRPVGTVDWEVRLVPFSSTEFTFPQLAPGSYEVRLRSVGPSGGSAFSPIFQLEGPTFGKVCCVI